MDPNANEGVSAFSGLKYFRALMEGSIARSAMLELFDINIEAAEPGSATFRRIATRFGSVIGVSLDLLGVLTVAALMKPESAASRPGSPSTKSELSKPA